MLNPAKMPEAVYEPPPNCVTLTRYFYPPSERPDPILRMQLQRAERRLDRVVTAQLQPHQREALICLVSDLTVGLATCPNVTFEKSFLVTALNRGKFQIAESEFFVFVYAEGKVQTRLWEKRKAETYLFSRGKLLFEAT